jgi:hypothetical protein
MAALEGLPFFHQLFIAAEYDRDRFASHHDLYPILMSWLCDARQMRVGVSTNQ